MAKTIKINQQFICLNCGHANPPAPQTCRNHCQKCLFSRHVDLKIPGDRASTCLGQMEPVGLDQNSKKGFIILHKCLKCGHTNRNLAAQDDDFNALITLSKRQNLSQD